MFKNKKIMLFITFIMALFIFSGIITYRLVLGKRSEKPVAGPGLQKDGGVNKLEKVKDTEYNKGDIPINDIFDGLEKLSVRSNNRSTNLVELTGKDKSVFIANFKALQKERVDGLNLEEMVDLSSYNYEIDIISKNIKVKFHDKIENVVIEKKGDSDNLKRIYRLDKKEYDGLVGLLEDLYFDKLFEEILYPLPDKIYLNARDENDLYLMSKREIKDLISKFKIVSIEDQQEHIGIPTLYPSYDITFKREDYEYSFYMKNHELMVVDTPAVYLYCKYEKELWDYIVGKLPHRNTSEENELKYLLRSERVIVKSLDGTYDFENATYYHIEIPRQILKSDIKEIENSNNTVIEEELQILLKFLINGKYKEVLVYNNYIVYGERTYHLTNVKEHITSTLMLP